MLSPFPDLKELILEMDTKLKQSHIFCDHFYSRTWNYTSVQLKNHKEKVFIFNAKLFLQSTTSVLSTQR